MKELIAFCPLDVLENFHAWYRLSFLICRPEQVTAPMLGQRLEFWWTLCHTKNIKLLDKLPIILLFI